MRNIFILSLTLLSAGCAAARGSPAGDACKAIPGEKVAEAVGAKLVKAELDVQRTTAEMVNSVCNYDFDNGDFVRISLRDYKGDYDAQSAAGHSRVPVDADLGKELGYTIYHEDGEKELSGVKQKPWHEFDLRMMHDVSKVEVDKTVQTDSAAAVTFKSNKIEQLDAKLRKIARLAAF